MEANQIGFKHKRSLLCAYICIIDAIGRGNQRRYCLGDSISEILSEKLCQILDYRLSYAYLLEEQALRLNAQHRSILVLPNRLLTYRN